LLDSLTRLNEAEDSRIFKFTAELIARRFLPAGIDSNYSSDVYSLKLLFI